MSSNFHDVLFGAEKRYMVVFLVAARPVEKGYFLSFTMDGGVGRGG